MISWKGAARASPWAGRGVLPGHSRIPCLFLAYGDSGIVEQSLTSVIENSEGRLDIDVVHNPGEDNADDMRIASLCATALAKGAINSYVVMQENISNNAVQQVLWSEAARYRKSPFTVVTDGDILLPPGALDEQIAILSRHNDVFACGLRMDATLWSDDLSFKQDFISRFIGNRLAGADYVGSATGMWFAMFRSDELFAAIECLDHNHRRFTDGNLKRIARLLWGKTWVATKRSLSRELNRERTNYYATKMPGTEKFARWSPEDGQSRYSMWNHDLFADYTVHRGAGDPVRVSAPTHFSRAAKRFTAALEDDLVCKELVAERLAHKNAYLQVRYPERRSAKGLYLILCEKTVVDNGLPRLWQDKSIIFMSEARKVERRLAVVGTLSIDLSAVVRRESLLPILDACWALVRPGGRIHVTTPDADRVRNIAREGGLPANRKVAALLELSDEEIGNDEARVTMVERKLAEFWLQEEIEDWARSIGATQEIVPGDGFKRPRHLNTHILTLPNVVASASNA